VGFLQKLFSDFAKNNVAVDMLATSEVSVSASVEEKTDLSGLIKDLEEYASVSVLENKAIICAVGEGLKDHSSFIAGQIFARMANLNIKTDMISLGASELNISFVVDQENADMAVKYLHHDFIRLREVENE
jgi:aspartate kinase